MSNHSLIKHLDSPIRILTLSINDIIAYLIPFFAGTLFESLVIVPTIGLLIIFFIKKLCKQFPKFYVMRLLYWNLPTKNLNHALKIKLPFSNKRFWVK